MDENLAKIALERMSEQELEKLILDLGKYAATLSRVYYWRTGNSDCLPNGETPQSVVSLALERVLRLDRKWNPQKYPDLRKYLMDVVADLISKLSTSKDNTALVRVPEEGTTLVEAWETGAKNAEPGLDWLARREPTPEEILISEEQEAHFRLAYDMLLREAKDDPVVLEIIKANENSVVKSEDVAAATGLDVKEIYKATRRLERMIVRVTLELSRKPGTTLASGAIRRVRRNE